MAALLLVAGGRSPAAADRREFLLLGTALTFSAFALYAVVVNLVPLLTGRGLSTTLAAWAIGLGGAGQVAGRLCYRPRAARLIVRGRTATVIGAGGLATLVLGILPGPAFALVATVAAVVAATVLLAAAVWRRPSTVVYALVALFAGGAAVFDIAEIHHQTGAGTVSVAVIAATVAALHVATCLAIARAASAARSTSPQTA